MTRTIFHVDMDAFYTACEVKRQPTLQGQPIVVGADPKGGRGRGVVAACSYEARAHGVRSGMPIARAFRKCRDAVFLRPDFAWYNEVSERVMTILRRYADRFEQLGIDEAYLDVSGRVAQAGGPQALARQMKEAIRQQEGLTCSIGVAPNKSVAKIASDMQKPDGLTVVAPDEVKRFLAPLPVTRISGVGKKTERYLAEQLHVQTIGELARIPGKDLVRHFGKNGVWLWAIANGVEEMPVEPVEEVKSISNERTFDRDVTDRAVLREALDFLAGEVHRRAQLDGVRFKTVGIKVRYSTFETSTRERTLTEYTDSLVAVRRTIHGLFREFERSGKAVRLVGVRVSHLQEAVTPQSSLLSWA